MGATSPPHPVLRNLDPCELSLHLPEAVGVRLLCIRDATWGMLLSLSEPQVFPLQSRDAHSRTYPIGLLRSNLSGSKMYQVQSEFFKCVNQCGCCYYCLSFLWLL